MCGQSLKTSLPVFAGYGKKIRIRSDQKLNLAPTNSLPMKYNGIIERTMQKRLTPWAEYIQLDMVVPSKNRSARLWVNKIRKG
ncbi:MAG: hypothetical protein ACYSSP_10525 [Planctomycetota bacterium]